MAKSDYGWDMFRQLTEVMARLEKVEEGSWESERKHFSKANLAMPVLSKMLRQNRAKRPKRIEGCLPCVSKLFAVF